MSTPIFPNGGALDASGATLAVAHSHHEAPLSYGARRLDAFFGPLMPGQVVLMESNSHYVLDVAYMAMASVLREPGASVVYVDGCNSANSYRIVSLCKRYRIDPDRALDRVHVCRAFTAYQMSSIIEEQLEPEANGARLLIVAGLRELYEDRDVRPEEASVLLARAAGHIKELAKRHGFAALVAEIGDCKKSELVDSMAGSSDRHLRLLQGKRRMRLADVATGLTTDYRPVPFHQTLLDEFWEV